MDDIKRILVVSTSTATCRKAVHYGISLARQFGAKLYVHHSDYDPFDLEGWGLPTPLLKALRENYLIALETDRLVLNRMIEKEKVPGMQVVVSVAEKPVAREVPRIVQEEKIDLLIMTASEEGRLEHFLFGTSMNEIVRTMPCSIMLVKERPEWE